jgi:hypothetical protein
MHDLVIRGGTVVDGSGGKPFTADVAVDGGLITLVGNVEAKGHEEIDATGLIVTPGFVDVHTHYDGQATWDAEMAPSSWHGVTTVVMGNCGVGFAPARPDRHEWLISLMEGVEDIPGTALAEGMKWDPVTNAEGILKGAGMGPSLTPAQRASLQQLVQDSFELFKTTVTRNRAVPDEAMTGAAYVAPRAIGYKLIDKIATEKIAYDKLVSMLR